MKNYLVLLLFLGISIHTGRAQVSSGSLLGDVRDEKRAIVPGGLIQARNDATGFTRSTISNSFGSYRIDSLLPGRYTVSAQVAGFQTKTVNVSVEVDQKVRVDFEMEVARGQYTVTIDAHASPLQTDEASE
ncbi:MAG TPA: carboxypeptidase-like regulatory domain-containing protein, partial [Bryobacteraceae bacterium]|nr:carboxypeptidase-like regulatory domain-containing protein [Bryobacteraceae bacterium]